jgi:hypothetical protein
MACGFFFGRCVDYNVVSAERMGIYEKQIGCPFGFGELGLDTGFC